MPTTDFKFTKSTCAAREASLRCLHVVSLSFSTSLHQATSTVKKRRKQSAPTSTRPSKQPPHFKPYSKSITKKRVSGHTLEIVENWSRRQAPRGMLNATLHPHAPATHTELAVGVIGRFPRWSEIFQQFDPSETKYPHANSATRSHSPWTGMDTPARVQWGVSVRPPRLVRGPLTHRLPG